jgi:hypothetical protein
VRGHSKLELQCEGALETQTFYQISVIDRLTLELDKYLEG